MFRMATSDGLFSGLQPVCRFREQLLNFNLFDPMGI